MLLPKNAAIFTAKVRHWEHYGRRAETQDGMTRISVTINCYIPYPRNMGTPLGERQAALQNKLQCKVMVPCEWTGRCGGMWKRKLGHNLASIYAAFLGKAARCGGQSTKWSSGVFQPTNLKCLTCFGGSLAALGTTFGFSCSDNRVRTHCSVD
jgi:hypothetical protein